MSHWCSDWQRSGVGHAIPQYCTHKGSADAQVSEAPAGCSGTERACLARHSSQQRFASAACIRLNEFKWHFHAGSWFEDSHAGRIPMGEATPRRTQTGRHDVDLLSLERSARSASITPTFLLISHGPVMILYIFVFIF